MEQDSTTGVALEPIIVNLDLPDFDVDEELEKINFDLSDLDFEFEDLDFLKTQGDMTFDIFEPVVKIK